MYGTINPNKSILTQKSAMTGLQTTQFYSKNPQAINVRKNWESDSNGQDLKKKYETMRNQLNSYKQMGKEFDELRKDNHEYKKVLLKKENCKLPVLLWGN